jgi:phytoene synthase
MTKAAHSNFAPAFSFLPSNRRQAMEILYAFTRYTDDIVDRPDFDPKSGEAIPTSSRRKRQKLNQWIGAMQAVLGKPEDFVSAAKEPSIEIKDEHSFQQFAEQFPGCEGLIFLPALKYIVDEFQIPLQPLFHLTEGVESDIEPQVFETFEDSADYCHSVATSVGFASLAIWGTQEPLFSDPVVKAAKACGIAFQWTNILRDIAEDFRQERVYLPQIEFKACGLTVNQILSLLDRDSWKNQKNGVKNQPGFDQYGHQEIVRRMEEFEEKYLKMMGKQFERCEIYYNNAAPLYQMIIPSSRKVFGMMYFRYYALYKKLAKHPFANGGRVHLSSLEKAKLYLRWKLLPCRKLK